MVNSTQNWKLCWWCWERRNFMQYVIHLQELIIQRQAVRKLGRFSPQFPFFMWCFFLFFFPSFFSPLVLHVEWKQDFHLKSEKQIGNTMYFCKKGTAASKTTLYFFPWKGKTCKKANKEWADFDLLRRYTEQNSSTPGFKNLVFYRFWLQSKSPSSRLGG